VGLGGGAATRISICAPNQVNFGALTTSLVTRRQPYSAYAVHLTTLSPPAFLGDGALIWLLWEAAQTWPKEQQQLATYGLLVWMFVSKFSKNLGHYVRYPADIALLPVSIMFGWFHGLIKLYAMFTLDVVSNYYNVPPLPVRLFSKLCLGPVKKITRPSYTMQAFTWQSFVFHLAYVVIDNQPPRLFVRFASSTNKASRPLGAVGLEQTQILTA
jgi:hypothetical protein